MSPGNQVMYGGQNLTALKSVAVKVFCEGRIKGDFRLDRDALKLQNVNENIWLYDVI